MSHKPLCEQHWFPLPLWGRVRVGGRCIGRGVRNPPPQPSARRGVSPLWVTRNRRGPRSARVSDPADGHRSARVSDPADPATEGLPGWGAGLGDLRSGSAAGSETRAERGCLFPSGCRKGEAPRKGERKRTTIRNSAKISVFLGVASGLARKRLHRRALLWPTETGMRRLPGFSRNPRRCVSLNSSVPSVRSVVKVMSDLIHEVVR
jgi:hypothetical protein